MNSLINLTRSLEKLSVSSSGLGVPVRYASKKASSSKRNPKQGKGSRWSIKRQDGNHVYEQDIIATQGRLRYHPGLNVIATGRFHLRALKEGKVIFTCEQADMDYSNSWIQKQYAGTEGTPIFKKYAHVIPKPQHSRFKLIDQV